MTLTIRKAGVEEAPVLGPFARTCFRNAFGHLFPGEALDLICAKAFTPQATEGLIRNGTWVAEAEEGLQGYISASPDPCPLEGLDSPHLELSRLYVAPPYQGKGVSDALMTAFMEEARRRAIKGVWLEAFEGSPRALRFYKRWGFRDLGPSPKPREGIHLPHRILASNPTLAIQ